MNAARRVSGAKIRTARLAAGMTQAALARAAQVSERNIVRWENDQHTPRVEHIEAIARATNREVGFFFGEEADASDDEEEDPVAALMKAVRMLVRSEMKHAAVRETA